MGEFGHSEKDMAEQAEHEQAEALRKEIEPLGQPSWEWIGQQLEDPIIRHALADHLLNAAYVIQGNPVLVPLLTQYHSEVEYCVAQGCAFLLALWRTKYEPL